MKNDMQYIKSTRVKDLIKELENNNVLYEYNEKSIYDLLKEDMELQRERNLYKTSLDESQEIINDYKTRIDKAIEYILNHELVKEKEHYVLNGNDLLNILRGNDE